MSAPVWDIYERICHSLPQIPSLIEWDNEIPGFDVLMAEADRAASIAAHAGTWNHTAETPP